MQKVRGFIYFKDKSFEDVSSTFKAKDFDNLKISFFNDLVRGGEDIAFPGVFVSGEADEGNSSNFISEFKKQIDSESSGFDVSIEDDEDDLKNIAGNEIVGNFVSIRIKEYPDFDTVCDVSSKISDILKVKNIYVRSCERVDGKPLMSVEVISDIDIDDLKSQVSKFLDENNLKEFSCTKIKLV